MRIWSSMVYAFRRSIGTPSDHGRLAILVRRSRGMASSYVSLYAVVVAVAGLSLAVVPATASAEPLCTDSWTGPAEGSWQTASNWSKEEVPGSSDVACIGSGKTVQVTGGSNQASSVQGEGALTISGGSLELVDALETSSIGGLGIGGGTLSIAGTFGVSSSFSIGGTPTVTGSGKLVVDSTVSGSIGAGTNCTVHPTLSGVTFVNEGSLTFGESPDVGAGAIVLEEGAEFENKGTFNNQSYDSGCGYGVGGNYYSFYSGGGTTSIVNKGTFNGYAGSSVLKVAVPFDNQGTVTGQTGALQLAAGGSGSSGTWSAASGAVLQLTGGSFSLSGDTLSGPGQVGFAGASVSASGVGTASDVNVSVSGGSLTIPESATMSDTTGTFSITGTPTISGPGRLVLGSSVTGSIGMGTSCTVHPTLSGVTFVNEGSLTFGESPDVGAGAIVLEEGAEFENKSTFNNQSYDSGCGYGVGGNYYSFYSGGGTTSIVNKGTFNGYAGSSLLKVAVPFDNQGTVTGQSGALQLAAGGSGSSGTWSAASGAALQLTGGSFSLSEDTLAGPGEVDFAGATVSASGVGTGSAADVSVSGGSLTIPEGAMMSATTGTFSIAGTPTISGPGRLVLGSSVSGSIGTGSGCSAHPTLSNVTFVNEGTLTFGPTTDVGAGAIVMQEGAHFENKGTFNDNSYDSGCGYGVGGSSYTFYNTGGATPSITNTGTFIGGAGSGLLVVAVPFSNEGTVEANTGTLEFAAGGVAERVATGLWAVNSGAAIVLSAGTFLVSEEANLSAVTITGATVERVPVAGPPHGRLLPYPYASNTITITGEGKSVGTGFSSASIELTPSASEEWKTLCGSLTPSLVDEFSCSWDTASGFYPDGLYKARAQLSDASEPPNTGPTPSITILVDNTPPTGSVAPPTYIGGVGATVDGTAKDSGSGVQSWQLQIAPEGSSEWMNACPAQTSPTSGETYQCSVDTTGLAEGAHSLRAIVTDRAGNEYTTSAKSTMVDNTPPTVSLDEVSEGLYVKGTISLKGTASDSISGVANWTPEIAAEGSTSWTGACAPQTTPISGSTYGCSLNTTGYSDGKYQIRARAENNATDTQITSAQTITIDNTPPTGSLDALERTSKGTITVKGPTSDPESGIATWQLEIRSTASSEWHSACLTQIVPIEGDEYGCSLDTTSLTDGSYQLHAVITDNAGNVYTTHPVTTHVHNSEESEEGPDPSCTDTWTGEAGDDYWQTAGNWSTSSVPTSSDRACIPSGATATIASGTKVGSITGEGNITVASGSLELADNTTVSEIGGLALDGTSLTGSGTLNVYSALTTTGSATISGSEEVVVESGASGVIDSASCTLLMLNGTTLINDGTLTLGVSGGQSGQLDMENGAHLNNAGTFNADSYKANCVPGSNEASIQNSGGSAPSVTNTGTFNVDVGSGNSTSVDLPFNTSGSVDVLSGALALSGGDAIGAGTWTTASGTTVLVAGGSYALTDAAGSGASFSVSGGTLSQPSGSSTIGGLALAGGTVEASGTLNVSSSISTTAGTVTGSGKLVIQESATGVIDDAACTMLMLNGATLTNDGTLTMGASGGQSGQLDMENGAHLDNAGTFNADSYKANCVPGSNEASLQNNGGSTSIVSNTGTFNVDVGSGNSTTVDVPFNTEGTVHVQTGAFTPSGGDTTGAGTWTTASGATVSVTGGSYSLTGAAGSGASFSVSAGALSESSGSSTIGGLILSGGTVEALGTLNVSSSIATTAGTLTGSGKLVVQSGATGVLDDASCTMLTVNGGTLVNDGTLTLGASGGQSGQLDMENGAHLDNAGTFNADSYEATCVPGSNNAAIQNNGGSTSGIANTGTFKVNAGSVNTVKVSIPFGNDGKVEAESGALVLSAGGIAEEATDGSWEASEGTISLTRAPLSS